MKSPMEVQDECMADDLAVASLRVGYAIGLAERAPRQNYPDDMIASLRQAKACLRAAREYMGKIASYRT